MIREQYYLDLEHPFAPNGYNVSKMATNCVLYGESNGMYGKLGKDNPNFGRKNTKETLEKMSEAQKGRKISQETRAKISKKAKERYKTGHSPNYNTHLTQEQKDKISNNNSIAVAQIDKETGEIIKIYKNALEAEKETGADNGAISACCKHKPHYNTAKGYKWEYLKNID